MHYLNSGFRPGNRTDLEKCACHHSMRWMRESLAVHGRAPDRRHQILGRSIPPGPETARSERVVVAPRSSALVFLGYGRAPKHNKAR